MACNPCGSEHVRARAAEALAARDGVPELVQPDSERNGARFDPWHIARRQLAAIARTAEATS